MSSFGDRFLTTPALFPARHAGERWGEEEALLDLPGGPYLVSGLTPSQHESVRERFECLPANASSSAVTVDVFRCSQDDFRAIDTRGWEYALDMHESSEGIALVGLCLMARIAREASRAALWTCRDSINQFSGVLENLLRPLVAQRVLDRGGLLVHSAAISIDGDAYLFAGPSGAGKSTIALLALENGYEVLSDDLTAVLPDHSGFRVLPLPFTGDLLRSQLGTRAVTLRAILRLEKGTMTSLEPLPRSQAAALLLQCAPYVNHDKERSDELLNVVQRLVSKHATGILSYPKGADVWPILKGL